MSIPPASPLDALLSRRAKALPGIRIGDPHKSADYISFSAGFPDRDSLPAESVIEATGEALTRNGEWALQYGHGLGDRNLANLVREKLAREQGIDATDHHILITAGAGQAIGLAVDVLVDWGDTIITEAPTWSGALKAFSNAGATAIEVPIDDDGTDVDAFEVELRSLAARGITPKFIYVIPSFQNPTGVTMTLARRQRLVRLAHEYGTCILEDDAYAGLRYDGVGVPPIYTLDSHGTTFYFGTLSKTLGAGIRLGWVLAHPSLIERMAALKPDGSTNPFAANVAAEWIPRKHEEHTERLKAIYRRRRDIMLDALAAHFPEAASWSSPEGGFFIWVTLPEGIDTGAILPQARERGVEYLPGSSCFVGNTGANTLRLSYSFSRDDEIEPGIRILAEVIEGELSELGLSTSRI